MIHLKPIFSYKTIVKFCNELKENGKRVCITHGAFDLFHHSHLDLLKRSAAICDYLIVGVDSDQRVSEYKDYGRPIVREKQRMDIINELDCVDVVFLKDTSLDLGSHVQLYKDLLVDVVSVGCKFHFSDRIEEQTVQAGAKLIKVRTEQDPNTTSIINDILVKYSDSTFEVPKERD